MPTDQIIKKLLEHDDQFISIQEQTNERFNEVTATLDNILVIVQRLDQERVFTFAMVKRMQDDIEQNQKDLKKIKQILKIA
jgi:glutathionylspermidine synthase